eukprot:GHVS01023244.1.p1 GENE.GHVS01023244.1~~GHVS01023244.1.p1  ORF type:complete len:667 (+),score=58.80 GHVS01023244.1:113-2113(+)
MGLYEKGTSSMYDMVGVDKAEKILYGRRCTDVFFLLLSFVFIGFLGFLCIFALARGNPDKLFHGYNYNGKLCGVDIADRPFVFWPLDPSTNKMDAQMPLCVSSCFTSEDVENGASVNYPSSNLSELVPPSSAEDLTVGPPAASASSTAALSATVSVSYSKSPVYATVPFAGSYCFPIDTEETANLVQQLKLGSIWMYASRSLEASGRNWYWLVAAGFMGSILAIIYLVLLKFAARGVIWTVLIITPIVLLAAGSFAAYMSFSKTSHNVVDAMNERLRAWAGYVGIAIALSGIVMAIGVFLLRNSIKTAASVMQAALECFQALPNIALFPLICMLLMSGVLVGGLWILSYLFTANEFKPVHTLQLGQGVNGLNSLAISGIHREFVFTPDVVFYIVVWIFGIIWSVEIINCIMQFVVSFTVSLWYFTMPNSNGNREFDCVFAKSFWTVARYHSGTVALGAALLAIFRYLRFAMDLCRRQSDGTGELGSGMFCCCGQCCAPCAEAFLRMINSSGMAECAISSTGYFKSCANAFDRLARDASSVIMLNGLTAVFSYVAAIGISVGVAAVLYYMFTSIGALSNSSSTWFIENPEAVAVVSALVCLLLSFIVMLTFDQITDTVLYCYLIEKEERHEAIYAPHSLRALVDEQDLLHRSIKRDQLLEMHEQEMA